MRKRIFDGILLFLVSAIYLAAMDQNVAIDDALSRVYSSASKIKNAKVISIVPFEYGPGITFKSVEDKIVLKLAKTGNFKVMDKKSLETIINEQKLSLTGLTEQTNMAKIGQLLNADCLLFGKVTLSGESIVINVNLKGRRLKTYLRFIDFIKIL